MIKVWQKNKVWIDTKIGQTHYTVGQYGCLISCLSMFSDWYKKYRDPNWMAKNLKFNGMGQLIWKSITESELPMKFVYRYYKQDDKKIKEILKSKDGVCVLQVNSNHWVALVGHSWLRGYRVNDPYYGDTVYLNQRDYRITGFAELMKK